MKLTDNVNVHDSDRIRGVVVLKKPDGTVVFKKENMIVQTGRQFIRENFVKNGLPTAFSDRFARTLDGYILTHMGFGRDGSATTFGMTSLVNEKTPTSTSRTALNQNTVVAGPGEMFIVFKATLNNVLQSDAYTAQELGLFLTKTDSPDLLFSRISFDPIPVSSGESYEVEYYIYF
jgi:hypothetical protein